MLKLEFGSNYKTSNFFMKFRGSGWEDCSMPPMPCPPPASVSTWELNDVASEMQKNWLNHEKIDGEDGESPEFTEIHGLDMHQQWSPSLARGSCTTWGLHIYKWWLSIENSPFFSKCSRILWILTRKSIIFNFTNDTYFGIIQLESCKS